MSANPLKATRTLFVDAIGPKATHAAEAGFVVFVLIGCVKYFPEYAGLLAALYGVEKTIKKLKNRKTTVSEATLWTLLRAIVPKSHLNHIRIQPIYFIVASGIGYGSVYTAAVFAGRTVLFLPF